MIIDFHTHIFPDKLAKRAIDAVKMHVKNTSHYDAPSFADGTLEGLKKSMQENSVDLSIVLPIATSIKQTKTINDFAEQIRDDKVISFGSLHPSDDEWENVMKDLKTRGFRGIKLHPEYQQINLDSPECIRVIKKAEELDMLVVYHAGLDVGIGSPVHSSPKMLSHVLEYVKGDHIIAAHMGGFGMWDDVEKYIVGTNVYLDTAVCAQYLDRKQYLEIIKKHGANKIILGSDSPWESPSMTISAIEKLDLTREEIELIKYKNALRLLGPF